MKAKTEQSQPINPNPVLSAGKDGTVLCSNEAGKPLLNAWGVEIGGKLPSNIVDLMQKVISRNNPEKIEVKVGKRIYLVVFHPLPEQERVNISGFDTSDQEEIEKKPLESEEKHKALFNLIEHAVQICEIIFDEKGQPIDNIILDVNLAYEKHSGLRQEQVVGRRVKEILPTVEQTWLDRYGEVVRTGKGMHFEEYNASLDKWFEVFASPMGGNRFIAVFSDITRRKQAEEALLQSEQHYRLLYETMFQGVVYQDSSGKIISMNPAAERILGKTPAEYLGSSSVSEEHLTIREDGSPFPGLEHPAMISLQTGRKVQDVVMGVYNPRDSCYHWININAIPIFRTGEDKPYQVYTLFDDITERKQEEQERMKAEKALSRERSLLESVMQTTDVMLVLLDPQFNFVWVNPAYAETCKLKPEEMVGKNHFALYPDAENEAIFRKVRDTGKGVFYKDKPFAFPDQPERGVTHWDWSLEPVKNSCGDVEGLVFSLRETTKYKQIEEALRESEERLRLLGDNLPDSALYQYIYEPDGGVRFLYISTGIERLNGVNAQDVLYDPNTLYRQVPPDYFEQLIEAEAHSARELSDFDMELPMRLPDGQLKWMRLHSRPRQLPNGGTVWDGVQIDVTERKRAEEALKKARDTLEEKVKERTAELEEAYNSLLENELRLNEAQKIAHIGNWDWDLQTDELYWSDEIYRIFRLDPLEVVPTYNEFLSYVDPEDRNIAYNSIQRALKGEFFSIEYRINVPDGEKRIVHLQGTIAFDDNGIPVRIRGTLQDITERKMAEEALERMDKVRIKEIHHRIKNNLQIISSLLDLQAEKFRDKNVIEAFREGQNRVLSMSLIHEELYKGEGTDTLDFSAYIKKLAENLFKTYSLSSKNISLSMDLEEGTFFDMDTVVPLGIIVNELVSNSLKHAFIGRDKGKIQIKLRREERICDTHKSLFSLTICDDGKGFPENLELESAESLGLQLVSILVDQLEGEIKLKRSNGTAFIIRFTATDKDNLASAPASQ